MSNLTPLFDWKSALTQTYQAFSAYLVEHLPQLLGAFALLLIGWLVAAILRLLARKVIRAMDALFAHAARKKGLQETPVRAYGKVLSDIVFWAVLLFFFAASAHLLEWAFFSGVTGALMAYLPRLLAGVLIILAGFALSGVVRTAVASAAASTNVLHPDLFGRIAQLTLLTTAMVIGVEQLGINVAFLTDMLLIVMGILLAGAALAFALGARHFIENVIGAITARQCYQVGQILNLDGVNGRLLEISNTALLLDTEQGRAVVPACHVHKHISEIISDSGEGGGR